METPAQNNTNFTPTSNMPPPQAYAIPAGDQSSSQSPPAPPPPPGQQATANSGQSSPPTITPRKGGLGKIIKVLALVLILIIVLGGVGYFLWQRIGSTVVPQNAELTWWGLWEDESIIQGVIDQYQAENPGITINYISQSKTDYRERLVNSLAQGQGPDIFRIHNTWVPMFTSALAPAPRAAITQEEFATAFYPVMQEDLVRGGQIMAMPLMYDGLALFINEDIFNTYSKTAPTTWTELRDMAIEMTIIDDNGQIQQSGVAMGITENVDHWPEIMGLLMLQNMLPNNSHPTRSVDNALAAGALDFYTSFSNEHGIWDNTLPPSTTYFATGKLAMYIAPSWRVHEILNQNPNLNFRVVPVPQLPKVTSADPDITYATYWVEGVWNNSENSEEAWKFLEYLSQPESLEIMYQNASQVRAFGELYPRVSMKSKLTSDSTINGFIALADNAKSWYLASRTFDGPTGINSQLERYFIDAINSANDGRDGSFALSSIAPGVVQVLSTYGLATPLPAPIE